MAVKLLVLGLPGSGKSGIARYIATYIGDKGWESTHFNDYATLQKMFHDDTESKQFKPAEHGGLDVLDHTVFDTALQRLEQEVNQYLLSAKQKEIMLIEFARNDYLRAFQQFSEIFLQDAYFLYLDTKVDICKQRIRKRIENPIYADDYYVSEFIFETYYHIDNGQYLSDILERDYELNKQRLKIIDNNCSLEAASKKIDPFIDTIVASELARRGTSAQPVEQFMRIQ
jgi:adenylate kinase family enzyme